MLQTIAVYVIGAVVLVYVGYKIYRMFSRRNRAAAVCCGCPSAGECMKARTVADECETKAKVMGDQVKKPSDAQAKEWLAASEWGNGLPFNLAAETDKIELVGQVQANPVEWKAAFDFLKNTDLKSLGEGKHELTADTYASVSEYITKDDADFEAHRKYIDIQYVISGREYIDIVPVEGIMEFTETYDTDKDIMFFKAEGFRRAEVDNMVFLVLFPSDGHRPCMKIGYNAPVKKVVVKIPYKRI